MRLIMAGIIFAAIISGCSGGSSTGSSMVPVTMTIPLTYTLNAESMGLHMPIRVGNSLVNVGVDTGSVGLRVLESALGNMSGITKTATPVVYGYADGVSISGVVAYAPVTIGQVTTNIKFMLIESVSCAPEKPHCPAAGFQSSGRAGLIGIRTDDGATTNGIWSPLGQLPGNLSSGFIISGKTANPNIIIGLTSGLTAGFNTVKLTMVSQPSANPAPYSLWNPVIHGAVSYPLANGSLTIATENGNILYDTGTSAYTIYNMSSAGSFAANSQITTYQTLLNQNNYNWNFSTGAGQFINLAVKTTESSNLMINTGNVPFTQLDVLYSIESGLIGFKSPAIVAQESLSGQMLYSDGYTCSMLPVCGSGQTADLSCVTEAAYNRCLLMQGLSQSGVSLNDSNNLYISMFQAQTGAPSSYLVPYFMSLTAPTTLFAGFTLTYSPDISAPQNMVGWPVNEYALQQTTYLESNPNSCKSYTNNEITSFGPWLSHCSSFAAWAESQVYGVIVPPAQPRGSLGYDWCGLADANNASLLAGDNGWESASLAGNLPQVSAQILANRGCAVVANYYNPVGAGHIAPILPSTWNVAEQLQQGSNYPRNVLVVDSQTFAQFLAEVGPEETQAGLYNFQHTVVLNGFYSELNKGSGGFESIIYFYNPASCN